MANEAANWWDSPIPQPPFPVDETLPDVVPAPSENQNQSSEARLLNEKLDRVLDLLEQLRVGVKLELVKTRENSDINTDKIQQQIHQWSQNYTSTTSAG